MCRCDVGVYQSAGSSRCSSAVQSKQTHTSSARLVHWWQLPHVHGPSSVLLASSRTNNNYRPLCDGLEQLATCVCVCVRVCVCVCVWMITFECIDLDRLDGRYWPYLGHVSRSRSYVTVQGHRMKNVALSSGSESEIVKTSSSNKAEKEDVSWKPLISRTVRTLATNWSLRPRVRVF